MLRAAMMDAQQGSFQDGPDTLDSIGVRAFLQYCQQNVPRRDVGSNWFRLTVGAVVVSANERTRFHVLLNDRVERRHIGLPIGRAVGPRR